MRRLFLASLAGALAGQSPHAAAEGEHADRHPDQEFAYLIVGARVLPESEPQPKWIRVVRISGVRLSGTENLSTATAIHALRPGRYSIREFVFREGARSEKGGQRLRLPEFEVEAGRVYYYGTVEVNRSGRDPVLRTLFDPDLHATACAQAPALLNLPLARVFAAPADALPPCAEAPAAYAELERRRQAASAPGSAALPALATDPSKAWLILGVGLVPEGRTDTASALLEGESGERLWVRADSAVSILPPGEYRVVQVYHRRKFGTPALWHPVENFPRVALAQGRLYYYGLVELDIAGPEHVLRRRYDENLLRRGCERLPPEMGNWPLHFLFDDAGDHAAQTCARSSPNALEGT